MAGSRFAAQPSATSSQRGSASTSNGSFMAWTTSSPEPLPALTTAWWQTRAAGAAAKEQADGGAEEDTGGDVARVVHAGVDPRVGDPRRQHPDRDQTGPGGTAAPRAIGQGQATGDRHPQHPVVGRAGQAGQRPVEQGRAPVGGVLEQL